MLTSVALQIRLLQIYVVLVAVFLGMVMVYQLPMEWHLVLLVLLLLPEVIMTLARLFSRQNLR